MNGRMKIKFEWTHRVKFDIVSVSRADVTMHHWANHPVAFVYFDKLLKLLVIAFTERT